MIKIYEIFLIIILLFCCISCSWDSVAVNTGYGQRTALYTDKQNTYKIKTINIEYIKDSLKLEFNFSKHDYDNFNCQSIGSKLYFLKNYNWFFANIGVGFRLTEIDERNKWLANSHLLADLSFSTGVKKEFDKFNIKLCYTLQHLSVPWRNDRGLNYDMIQVGVIIPF